MADKTPVRVVFNAESVATGMAEFQTGETVPIANGGTGISSIGSAGYVLRVNAAGNALEFAQLEDLADIVSVGSTLTAPSNADFTITTAGTGNVVLNDINVNDNRITPNRTNDNLELYGAGSGKVSLSGLLWPTSDGSANQFLKTDGSGTLSFADLSIGDLDIVGSTISTPSNADLTLSPGGTGQVVVSQGAYTITVPNKTGTLAMDSDTSFPQSTITAAPGSSGNTDMGSVTDILTDAFAVAIADMFTCEEPLGSVQTTDLGAF